MPILVYYGTGIDVYMPVDAAYLLSLPEGKNIN